MDYSSCIDLGTPDAVEKVLDVPFVTDQVRSCRVARLGEKVPIVLSLAAAGALKFDFGALLLSSFYLFMKQFHKNMTADNTRTGPTRLAKHSQWPQ